MSESLPIVFAIFPALLSCIALIWLIAVQFPGWLNWAILASACGSIITFAYMTGPWAFSSYYLRCLFPGLFVVATACSYFQAKRRSRHSPPRKRRISVTPILVLLLFSTLDALAVVSRYSTVETFDAAFPLRKGRYCVLQGGSNAVTNPFHTLGGSSLAVDIVKLNAFGNRADGIAPRALGAYQIFSEPLQSPCSGKVSEIRDGRPDTTPGNPDTGQPAGNYIVLKCDGTDVRMAHLKRGSIEVTAGETVVSGQALAQIGNSGNTLEPHLHIDAMRNGREIGLRFDGRMLSINSIVTRQ